MNILFLMTDQQRLDHAGFSGASKMATPNLDRLAESVGFTNCQTVNPICMPARSALMTGRYSHQIGALNMSGDLSRQIPTYMKALQQAGYHTAGIGKFHFLQTWSWGKIERQLDLVALKEEQKQGYGFDVIWETAGKQLALNNYCDYCQYLEEKGLLQTYLDSVAAAGSNRDFVRLAKDDEGNGDPSVIPDEDYVDVVTADKIIEQILGRPRDKPFCMLGSFCSPHRPFDPPQSYLDKVPVEEVDDFIPGPEPLTAEDKKKIWKQRRSYKAMMLLLDDQIGRILQTLEEEGILDETLILFTSDHGEMMGDHGRLQKATWHHASLCVPTAIRHPDHLNGLTNASPVELTDLTATILDVAGLDPKEALSKRWPSYNDRIPCRSLMPIVRGESDSVRDFAFSECMAKWQCVVDHEWKYVRELTYDTPGAAKEHLYHLKEDPGEQDNRVGDPSLNDLLQTMRDLRDWVNDTTPPCQTRWAPLSPEGEKATYGEE